MAWGKRSPAGVLRDNTASARVRFRRVWSGRHPRSAAGRCRYHPALDARGILHSVASKNDEAEALAALERFGLAEYFLSSQINWGPKSESVRRIAKSLDIGLDTIVFIDDQAFERSEVAETLPIVSTLPETFLDRLLTLSQFDVPVREWSVVESREHSVLWGTQNMISGTERRKVDDASG